MPLGSACKLFIEKEIKEDFPKSNHLILANPDRSLPEVIFSAFDLST
jgi:hypothetical protein